MAVHNNARNETYVAGADLSAKQYHFVKVSGSTVVAATLGSANLGVLFNNPLATQAASVCFDGMPMVYAGATITAGAQVASDSAGKAITATTGHVVCGIAREDAVVNQLFQIDFFRGGNVV